MIGYRVKELYFDKQAVQDAIGKKAAGALNYVANYIKKGAKNSMRRGTRDRQGKKKPSAPGKPPKVWSGHLKNFLDAQYDPASGSAVIGPVLLKRMRQPSGSTVPRVLEEGGTVTNTRKSGQRWQARVQRHPYMMPVFKRSIQRPNIQAAFERGGISAIGPVQ